MESWSRLRGVAVFSSIELTPVLLAETVPLKRFALNGSVMGPAPAARTTMPVPVTIFGLAPTPVEVWLIPPEAVRLREPPRVSGMVTMPISKGAELAMVILPLVPVSRASGAVSTLPEFANKMEPVLADSVAIWASANWVKTEPVFWLIFPAVKLA